MSDVALSARALETLLGDWRAEGASSAYHALADRIRLLVLDGRVPVGTRLPAERELAERLGLSRTTVTAAYRRLRELDLLHSVRGSGSVARLPGRAAAGREGAAVVPSGALRGATSLPPSHGALGEPGGFGPSRDGAPGYLDLSKAAPPALPWLADVAREASVELAAHLQGSGFDPIGLPVLRQAIADRYAARGLPTSPDQIMVTIGAQHAIALLSRALVGRGDRAVIEAPTYPHAYEALRVAGARLVPVSTVPHDAGDTWEEAEALARAFRHANPAVAYLMPDFHNPTGRTLGEAERERVLDAAARQGAVVVADETTAELDIDREVTPLPLAAYGPAVLIGSVGKTVWGGLRIGWIRADRPLLRRLLAVRMPGDLGTPILEQLIAARVLGRMDDILEFRRDQLRAGRERVERLVAELLPSWHVPHVDGGITTWAGLGAPVSSQLALAARAQGLVIAAGPRFGIDGAFERFLRLPICYGAEETDAAVQALARAWHALPGLPVPETLLAEVV